MLKEKPFIWKLKDLKIQKKYTLSKLRVINYNELINKNEFVLYFLF